jgi:acyl carrier protein phosphodiesterase
MNFLGHFYLSYPDKNLLLGNFIADDIKGKAYQNYPSEIAKGILMHRTIDDLTDHHPYSKICLDMVRPAAGKFAGVALDILYDYEIARNWNKYSDLGLKAFSERVYTILYEMKEYFTKSSGRMFQYMSGDNWLLHYSTKDGIQTTLENMGRRIKHENNLDKIMPQFEEYEVAFGKQFELFFKELQKEINKKYKTPNP